MQSRACDKGWKKALWLTGITVVGGTAIAGYWWVPALTTAIAGGTAAIGQPETTTTTTTTTTLSPLVEDILSGSTPINFMKASEFRNLIPSEKEKVNQHWRENQTPDTPFYFIEEGIPCRVDMPIDVNFCRTGTVNTMSDADIDTAVKAQAITLEMISKIPPYRIDARINAGGKWSQYLYNKEGKYLRKNGSDVYFYSMPELRSKWNLPWKILMEGKDTEDTDGNTYTWH